MTIETKYDIGQEVWFMKYNMPYSADIIGVRIGVINGTFCNLQNHINVDYCCRTAERDYLMLERHLYPTKEELLKSL